MNPNFPPKLAGHLAESVHAARRRYRKRLTCCQKKFSEKAVHDLRIETRRILALLDLLDALHFEAPDKLRKTFKKRLDAFDDLRDTHVQLVLLKPLWPKFPEARDFKKHLCKCEKQLEREMSREIKTSKAGWLNRKLKEIEKSLRDCAKNPPTLRESASQSQLLLGAAFRRVVILRRQIQRSRPATIHRMRVAFKRFRYTAELLQPFLPQFTPARLERMKDFQGAAGDIQDVAVLLERIEKEIKKDDIKAACVKTLRDELLKSERRAIDKLMERIDELKDFEPEQPAPFATKPETASK